MGSGIRGTLPAAWSAGFPSLRVLELGANEIEGFLPDSWAAASALPWLRVLKLEDNRVSHRQGHLASTQAPSQLHECALRSTASCLLQMG